MVTDDLWISMASLLFDQKLSEQVRTTIVHTLRHIFKVRELTSAMIKMKFQQLVMTDDISKRLLVAAINALHSMTIRGATLEAETVEKLRYIVTTGDGALIESVHELLDFLDHKRILSNSVAFMGNSSVKKELTVTQNTSVSRSQEESIEPTSKFLSLDHLLGTVGHFDRKFNVESQPKTVSTGHNQAWYRSTLQEIDNLAALAKQGHLKDQDFTYLLKKFQDGRRFALISPQNRDTNTTYEIITGDFRDSVKFQDSDHFVWISSQSRHATYEIIAGAFRYAAKIGQAIPSNMIDGLIKRLTVTNEKIHRICAETQSCHLFCF